MIADDDHVSKSDMNCDMLLQYYCWGLSSERRSDYLERSVEEDDLILSLEQMKKG